MRADDERGRRRAGTSPVPRGARERWADAVEVVAARVGVSPRAVSGLLAVTVVVLLVLGSRAALVQARSAPVELAPGPAAPSVLATGSLAAGTVTSSSGPVPVASRAGTAAAPTSASPPTGSRVVVHVVGRVARPGVVRLPVGARVQEAVAAAGGARRGADLARLNLARVLVDGEQVVVPRPGEAVGGAGPAGAGAASSGATASSGGPSAGGALVDLNSASLAELDTLPGVGPVLAQRILDWRTENGRFTSVDELGEVSGIGDAVLGRLRPLVRV